MVLKEKQYFVMVLLALMSASLMPDAVSSQGQPECRNAEHGWLFRIRVCGG